MKKAIYLLIQSIMMLAGSFAYFIYKDTEPLVLAVFAILCMDKYLETND